MSENHFPCWLPYYEGKRAETEKVQEAVKLLRSLLKILDEKSLKDHGSFIYEEVEEK